VLSSNYALSQEINDGIYFKISEKKCVFKKIKIKDSSSSICIPNSPIFPFEDIVSLGNLEMDAQSGIRTLLIELSNSGRKRLSVISKLYLGEDLAFVFDNKVVFLLKINEVISSGRISLEEKVKDSSLEPIREAIEKILLQNNAP
jgi:preprotein translocase subunit SecD